SEILLELIGGEQPQGAAVVVLGYVAVRWLKLREFDRRRNHAPQQRRLRHCPISSQILTLILGRDHELLAEARDDLTLGSYLQEQPHEPESEHIGEGIQLARRMTRRLLRERRHEESVLAPLLHRPLRNTRKVRSLN